MDEFKIIKTKKTVEKSIKNVQLYVIKYAENCRKSYLSLLSI